jgi:glutaredoxin
MDTERRDGIASLLEETGRAHHAAFAATDGEDPDWPIWYAEHTQAAFAERFGMTFSKSQLIYCLMTADFEHRARAPEIAWPEFFATEMLTRYGASETPSADKLALYHFDGCPFCARVRAAIDLLDLDVELRSIVDDPENRDELVAARGRATVPVLKITAPDDEARWMPESQDIINYLESTYG